VKPEAQSHLPPSDQMLRWLLVEAAQTAVVGDPELRRAYQRLKFHRVSGVAKVPSLAAWRFVCTGCCAPEWITRSSLSRPVWVLYSYPTHVENSMSQMPLQQSGSCVHSSPLVSQHELDLHSLSGSQQ